MPQGQHHHEHFHTIKHLLESATEPLSAREIGERVHGRAITPPEWFAIGGVLDMLRLERLNSPRGLLYARKELYKALDKQGRIGPEKPPTQPLYQLFKDYFGRVDADGYERDKHSGLLWNKHKARKL